MAYVPACRHIVSRPLSQQWAVHLDGNDKPGASADPLVTPYCRKSRRLGGPTRFTLSSSPFAFSAVPPSFEK
jgi:hypothetical protein